MAKKTAPSAVWLVVCPFKFNRPHCDANVPFPIQILNHLPVLGMFQGPALGQCAVRDAYLEEVPRLHPRKKLVCCGSLIRLDRSDQVAFRGGAHMFATKQAGTHAFTFWRVHCKCLNPDPIPPGGRNLGLFKAAIKIVGPVDVPRDNVLMGGASLRAACRIDTAGGVALQVLPGERFFPSVPLLLRLSKRVLKSRVDDFKNGLELVRGNLLSVGYRAESRGQDVFWQTCLKGTLNAQHVLQAVLEFRPCQASRMDSPHAFFTGKV